MALTSTKYYVTVYTIFLIILSLFSVTLGINTLNTIPVPPEFNAEAVFGGAVSNIIQDIETSLSFLPVLDVLIGIPFQIATTIIQVLLYFVIFMFFLLNTYFLFFISGTGFVVQIVNAILLIFRIIVMIELIPYIKNMIHPTTQASGS